MPKKANNVAMRIIGLNANSPFLWLIFCMCKYVNCKSLHVYSAKLRYCP